MQTVGASIMGVTMGCARCHNHKFDPITISDYYAMTGVFQGVEFGSRFPEFSPDHPRREPPPGHKGPSDPIRELCIGRGPRSHRVRPYK